ncbi:hypothetical protein NL676_031174 [Syzygium grande]|nr:hypothetical protein NL676_031174 [Syzygium grande]
MSQNTLGELLEKDLANGSSPSTDSAALSPLSLNASGKMDNLLNALWELSPEVMEEIKKIISFEGAKRKERHEKLEKWIQRLDLAGFGNVPLSYYGRLQVRRLMQGYNCDPIRSKKKTDAW